MAYVGKITDTNHVTGKVASTLLGECDTGAGIADKVVDCVWFDTLMLGVEIRVWFSAGNTAANPTLNVNNTGALPIYNGHNMSRPSSQISSWDAGEIVSFTYISIAGGASGWWMNNRRRDLDNAKFFAVCSETADTPWKTITVDGLSELNVGTKITVLFTYGNTVDNIISGRLPLRVIGDDGLDTGDSAIADSVIETSPILDANTVVTLVCTSTIAHAVKWRVVESETIQKLTTTSSQIHPILVGANTGGAADIADTSSDLYKNRFTPNMLYPKCVGVSDGGAFISKYLYNYMVFDPNMYELLTSAPSDWTTKWFTYYTKSGSTYSNVTGNVSPTFQTNTYYRLKYESTTGYVISATQFGNATRRYDGSRYSGPLIKGYNGKSSPTGDGGQLAVVSGNGLTIVSGGEYGDMLAGMIDDCQAGYKLTTSQPSNWSTNYKYYFRKSGYYYVHVDDETAPTWEASTFYYGPERLNLFTDSDGNPNISVAANLRGDSDALILASEGAIFFVGPAGTSNEYGLLLAEPYDWSSNWTDRYQGNVYTKSGSTYTAVTSSSAPSFQYETYYMLKEIRRGIYFHPGASDYSSRPRLVPSENGTALLGTQSNHWRSAYIDTVYGELDGSISSSTTAVTQDPLDNSTKVATTEYVDSLANRYGRASYNQSWPNPATNVWAKVAHCTVEVKNATQNLVTKTTFLVSQRFNNSSKRLGILTIESNSKASDDTILEASWLVADPGIDPENYVVVSTDTNISATTRTSNIELWVKWTYGYEYILFKPLIEQAIGATRIIWTFDNPVATSGQAAYTAGTTTAVSSLVTLKNDISGNAATATTATSANYATSAGSADTATTATSATSATTATTADSATDATNAENANKLKVSTTNPSSQTTYYPLFQSSGTSSAKTTYYNTGLRYLTKVGTTGTSGVTGLARLQLGYGASSTSTSDKAGELVMYSDARNQYTMTLKPDKVTDSNKTILLQNKSGTIAVAYNGGSMFFQSNTSAWGKVMSIVCTPGSSAKIFGVMLAIQQSAGIQSAKAAGILQVSARFESSSGNLTDANTRAMWLYAAGNIYTSKFKLVAHHSTPSSGSATLELWIQNVANYQSWTVTPITENTNNAEVGMFFTFHDSRDGTGADQSLISSATPTGDLVKNSEIMTPVTS